MNIDTYAIGPDSSIWDDVVFSTALGDPHYSKQYWSASGNFNPTSRPLAFVYREGDRIFANPILVSPIVSFPGSFDAESVSGYSGAVSSCLDAAFLRAAWGAYAEFVKREKIIAEFQRLNPILGNERNRHPSAHIKHDRDIVVVDLELDPTSNYRKGLKSDLKSFSKHRGLSKKSKNVEDIASFARIYAKRMEALNASRNLRFDFEYFRAILDQEKSLLHVAMIGNDVVAGIITIESDNTSYYHLSAHDDRYVTARPIHHLVAQAIADAKVNRKTKFILGGGRTTSLDDSLLLFKSGFSKARLSYKTALIVHDEVAYREACAPYVSASNDWVLPWKKPLAARIDVGA